VSPISATFHPSEVAHEIVSWLHDRIEAASTIDWVLLLIALAIAYFLVKSVMAVTRVGPTEVDTLDYDGKDASVHALTARLRERLNALNLSSPAVVPSGSPQTALVALVGASPVPQAAFIAKLFEVVRIPEPIQFTLSGTILDVPKPPDTGPGPGVRIWLRPNRSGKPLLTTVVGTTVEDAIETAAFLTYRHITREARGAFPEWARWNDRAALEAYEQGMKAAGKEKWSDAVQDLDTAVRGEPSNALARLQLANAHERRVADNGGDAVGKLEVLSSYEQIAEDWPHLVQAHYRAGVLAGTLAGLCGGDETLCAAARAALDLPRGTVSELESAFAKLASSEFTTVKRLLRPWFLLLHERRLRSQFEPTTGERRQMKRAMSMSKQCLRVRTLGRDGSRFTRAWAAVKLGYSVWVVRGWHLAFGMIRVDWQTHYIAACFESLLLKRVTDGSSTTAKGRRERAFKHLEYAIREGRDKIPREWVLQDPDLAPLRNDRTRWNAIRRLLGPLPNHNSQR
jgi:hypothetical protein